MTRDMEGVSCNYKQEVGTIFRLLSPSISLRVEAHNHSTHPRAVPTQLLQIPINDQSITWQEMYAAADADTTASSFLVKDS